MPRQSLIHVFPAAEELGRVFQTRVGIVSAPGAFARAVADRTPAAPVGWTAWRETARADYEASLVPDPHTAGAPLDPAAIALFLAETLPDDAIVTIDAGNFSGWAHRFLRYRRPGRQVGATSGAMGYAVPSSIAASLRRPDATVVGFVGDGGLLMTGMELATAQLTGARPIVLVFDNGMYGTIRMHQERDYPTRISATRLANPDFAAFAESFGAFGRRVDRTEDFPAAFEAARASGRAAVLSLAIDPEHITTRTTLSAITALARS